MNRLHILDEIKRTAAQNGGAPLGWRKFRNETGIGDYDWQKYWPRWSDAQREAGFAPNVKNIAYGNDILIEKFIGLMREVQEFPSKGHLRVKGHSDPKFPNEKTLRRLGNKSQLAAKIVAYCQKREGYDDVVQLCAVLPVETEQPSDDYIPEAEEIGFVYLIRSGRHYKIGKTNAAGRREYELAIQLPEKPKTVHVIKTDDPTGVEAYWHQRFASKRKGGEWFELSAADVSVFKRRKFM